jgi:hypothetical protein
MTTAAPQRAVWLWGCEGGEELEVVTCQSQGPRCTVVRAVTAGGCGGACVVPSGKPGPGGHRVDTGHHAHAAEDPDLRAELMKIRITSLDPARPARDLLEDLLAGIYGCFLLYQEYIDFDDDEREDDVDEDEVNDEIDQRATGGIRRRRTHRS